LKRTYDAAGNKLQKLISTEEETKTTDYIANFVYRNDTLQYMLTGQGRTTISPEDNSSNEEFFVKDHLGNIRSIIDAKEYNLRKLNLVKRKSKLSLRKVYLVRRKLHFSLWKVHLVGWKFYLVKRTLSNPIKTQLKCIDIRQTQ